MIEHPGPLVLFIISMVAWTPADLNFMCCHCIYLHTQPKMNNLFWPDENSIEQCFAANIVQC